MHKILVVGQTPPPYGGQAVMIEQLLRQEYSRIKLFHVRMCFSREMDDIGRFQIKKVWHLLTLILRIFASRIWHQTKILYYPPSGPNKTPMYRDLAILICTRWMFSKTIFHFHAGGITELNQHLSRLEKLLFWIAYHKPDGAFLLSDLNPRDDKNLHAKQTFIIPYGIEDQYQQVSRNIQNDTPTVLYVGILKESKGVLLLLDALRTLKDRGVDFKAVFVGKFESNTFEQTVMMVANQTKLKPNLEFPGVLTGDEKWQQFANADIFCYPTFFESETFGLVVLEAMQFKLPTIVTNWRGVPSLVSEGKTGFIVPIKDSDQLADKIELLCKNEALAAQMGNAGREIYLGNYSLTTFRNRIEKAFVQVAEQRP